MHTRPRVVTAALVLAIVAAPLWRLESPTVAWAVSPRAEGARPASREAAMVWIPAGRYEPLFKRPRRDPVSGVVTREARPVEVAGFWLARHAVTNAEYLEFVREHPEWRRSRARKLFVDEAYLRHWRTDLDFGDSALGESPVVNVSWFAARSYCAAHGRQLPTVDQWEYAAAASEHQADATSDSTFEDRLREWYSRPTPARLAHVGSTFGNVYGVWDLHGLVWEWTLDFSAALVNGESRADAALDRSLYCGSGATNAADFRDYSAFMRFAFRSSLSARYGVANLGFREAASASPLDPHARRERR